MPNNIFTKVRMVGLTHKIKEFWNFFSSSPKEIKQGCRKIQIEEMQELDFDSHS